MLCSVGAPSPPMDMKLIEAGCLTYNLSWNSFSSDIVCEPVLYSVIVLPPDGVITTEVTNLSYNIAGLSHNNNYSIIVVGSNNANINSSIDTQFRTSGKLCICRKSIH